MIPRATVFLLLLTLNACRDGSSTPPVDLLVHEPSAPVPAKVCGLDHFCWYSPLPQGQRMNALWGAAWNDLWAGTSDGLLHFDGSAWSFVATPGGSNQVRSLWGSGAADVWAAGDALWHWDGKAWSAVTGLPDPGASYLSITGSGTGSSGSGLKEVWLLEDTGDGKEERHTILYWNGAQWTKQYGPVQPSLYQLLSTGPGAAWAVGQVPGSSLRTGQVLQLSSGAWRGVTTPASDPLHSLWASGPADLWAVGGKDILHWNGKVWSFTNVAAGAPLLSVFGTSPGDIWATGVGAVLHQDGTSWSSVWGQGGSDSRFIRAVWSSGPSNSWAAGDDGLLLHQNGSAWSSYAQGNQNFLNAVSASSPTEAWAVGGYGTALHFNGQTWTAVATGVTDTLAGVWTRTASEAWAVGGDNTGRILHWDGHAWSAGAAPAFSLSPGAVWGTSATEVWAVGPSVLLHWDGTSWTQTGPGDPARSVWASSPSDVWVLQNTPVGGAQPGSVYHYDGASWSLIPTGSTAQLAMIWGSGPSDVWVASDDGASLSHWTGTAFASVPTTLAPGGPGLTSIWGSSATDLWAAGQGTPILHWDGLAFSTANGAETRSVSGLSGSGKTVWAVGPAGKILGPAK